MRIDMTGTNVPNYSEGAKEVQQVEKVSQVNKAVTSTAVTSTAVTSTEEMQNHNSNASEKHLEKVIEETNKKLEGVKTKCEFSYVKEANRVSIKVVNSETDEVIREIPTEETLKAIEKLKEVAGMLIDQKI